MRILAAFDKCKGSLSAREICCLAEEVILSAKNLSHVQTIPLTDGGEGFVELLTSSKQGKFHSVSAKDSLGRNKKVKIGLISAKDLSVDLLKFANLKIEGEMAIVEMSSIAGLCDLKENEKNPWLTSTYGVGQLLNEANILGVSAILLGIGGSSTNDMGAGALGALGVEFLNKEGNPVSFPCPESWSNIEKISTNNLFSLPPIRIACDVSNHLLGKGGATYQFGPQKGLSFARMEEMEDRMTSMSEYLCSSFQKPLVSREQQGSGAAGGIGYGLNLAYQAEFVPGFALTEKWFGLEKAIRKADLILTGEGRFDSTSLYGKGPYEIIRMASKFNKKVILLAGSVEKEVAEKCKSEFSDLKIVPFGNDGISLAENLDRASEFFSKELLLQLSLQK